MKSYDNIEDLLSDKSFKDWVLKGDGVQQTFWKKWQNHLYAKIRERINSKGKRSPIPIYTGYRPKSEKWARAAIVTFLLMVSTVAILKMDFPGQKEQQAGSEEKKEVWIT